MKKLVATFALVVIVGCTSTPPTPSPGPTATPQPTSTHITATPSPAPTPKATSTGTGVFPANVLGMPVHSVAEMRELIGSSKIDGRYIAVAGYWSRQGVPCPYLPHASPITGFCSGITFADVPQLSEFGYIGDSDIVAVPETINGNLLEQSQTQYTPGAVVIIGHRGDARAAQCLSNCFGTFVIDDVAWVNGSLTPDPNTGPFASAFMPGEQLMAAIETDSALMSDVDPRFIGQSTGMVRYVRVATDAPDADG